MLLIIFLSLLASGSCGMQCYTGSGGEHGIPYPPDQDELDPMDCNVTSCARIQGKIQGKPAGGWSCGLDSPTTGCVQGIPHGIPYDVGETLDDAVTCFCDSELCNVVNFCDDLEACQNTSPSLLFSLPLLGSLLLIHIFN